MVGFADQRASFPVVVLGTSLADDGRRTFRLPGSLGAPPVVPPGEDAVLHVEFPVDVLPRGAGAGLQEALLEVVTQEGVKDRVHCGVGVAENSDQEEYCYCEM